jgi:DNA-binding NarL/FixJ family response regulator
MIKIAIADDHKIVREGICGVIKNISQNLDNEYCMNVVIQAANGQELINQLNPSTLPDIILLDIQMPVLNGLETIKLLLKQYPLLKIIMLTMHDEKQFIIQSLDLGAKSYLLKDVEPEEMKTAIIEVFKKGFYISEPVTSAMATKIGLMGKPKMKMYEQLTKTELKVLELICSGNTTQEIADKLFNAVKTIEGHRENIRAKMNVRNTAEMIICAIQNQLVDVNSIKINQ